MPDHAVQTDLDLTAEEEVGPSQGRPEEPVLEPAPVVVRRHAGVAALIGAAASAVAIAYLWRASQTLAVLDWALFGVMALVAAGYLASLVDARTPLLVADELGIRLRLGQEWRGLPWEAIGHVVVHPRRGLLRDGRLVVVPSSLARALDGLDARGRRHVLLNQKMYGAPLAVPLGLTTRVSDKELGAGVAALAHGRAEVVELDARTLAPTDDAAPEAVGDDAARSETDPTLGTRTARGAAVEASTEAPRDARPDGVAVDHEAPTARHLFPRVHDVAADTETRDRAQDAPAETAVAPADADALAAGQDPSTDVTASVATTGDEPAARVGDEPSARPRGRSILGGIGLIVSRVAKGAARDEDRAAEPSAPQSEGDPGPAETQSAPATTAPLRDTRPGLRAEATLDLPTADRTVHDPAEVADRPTPGVRELHRPGSVDLVVEPVGVDGRVRPISTLGDPVEPLVIDDYVTEPAYDPVVGPEITAARTRLGLSVDELAERTRIRPHVIESIEVDDFAPCGGDFYARGHLRTLARILGKDPAPLLAMFEDRYATAPINARRVFEAELATGMTGSMRATAGGPRWGLLIGVVLCLVLLWGVLRLFAGAPETPDMPSPVINGAAMTLRGLGVPV
jgi:hypothetical protein